MIPPPLNVSPETAYNEACTALGAELVARRLMADVFTAELAQYEDFLGRLHESLMEYPAADRATFGDGNKRVAIPGELAAELLSKWAPGPASPAVEAEPAPDLNGNGANGGKEDGPPE